jgi:pyridoxal phosphate-dependent aminotransferase EpsN
VPVVADAAEALGATYKGAQAGTFGRCAAFSFNGNKIITTSAGGMLVASDRALVERARHLSTQARQPVAHYEHHEVGYNYRMSNLLAAVGRAQLETLPAKLARRRQINHVYRTALASEPGVTFMPEAPYGRSNCWLTSLLINAGEFGADREGVRLHLERCGIEARPVWKPLHLQGAFEGCRIRGGAVATRLFEEGLCLPSGSSLPPSDQHRVIAAIGESREAVSPLSRAIAV